MKKKLIDKYSNTPVQVKASIWFLICVFLQRGISLLTTPIFTRILNAADYGAYGVWNSWYSILAVFVSLNLYYGVYTSGLVRYEEDRESFSLSLISLNLISVLAWLLIYIILHQNWNEMLNLSTEQMLMMFSMIWTSSIFSFWSAEQRVDFKYRNLVILTIIMSALKPSLGILFISCSANKVNARIFGLFIVELVTCTPIFINKILKNHRVVETKYWKYALSFSIPLIPHYLSQVILNTSDRIMIQRLVGNSEAGIYNLAYSIALIMTMFNNALMQTIEPWMYRKLKDNQSKDIAKIAYGSFVFVAFINILLILLAPEIVKIFAPNEYFDAIWLIPPIAISVFFMYQYTFFAVIEFYYKKTKMISIATVGGAVLNLITNYVFIKLYGYRAAAYTTLICYLAYAILHYIFSRNLCIKQLGYEVYDFKIIALETALFITIGMASMLLYNYTVIRYVFIGTIGILIFIFRNKIIDTIKKFWLERKEVANS